jgi:ABC-type Fe3+-hydroxamate transport system substrate-binding protein
MSSTGDRSGLFSWFAPGIEEVEALNPDLIFVASGLQQR